MRTFPAVTSPDGRLIAFEVENAYIGPSGVVRLLRQVEGVSDMKRRHSFSQGSDVHARFKFRGHPCMVWEPYGDSSRYWIGPENPEEFSQTMQEVEKVFGDYSPPLHRALVGDILSLRFLRR